MKRNFVWLALATACVVAGTAQAQVTTNEWTSVNYAGYVPCANGGTGEILSGRIDIHNLESETVNDNNISWKFQFQPQGTMVGRITGDTYRVTGVTHGSYTQSLATDHSTLTYVSTYHLIGPGAGNNLAVREVAHVTIDKDENPVVEHDDFSIECS